MWGKGGRLSEGAGLGRVRSGRSRRYLVTESIPAPALHTSMAIAFFDVVLRKPHSMNPRQPWASGWQQRRNLSDLCKQQMGPTRATPLIPPLVNLTSKFKHNTRRP